MASLTRPVYLPDGRRKVPGTGPRPSRLMGVGEAPGFEENLRGIPFVGKAGRELRRYGLQAAKINFDEEVYLTNVVKYRPITKRGTGNNPPTAEDVARDEPELLQELSDVDPEFVIAIGRYAARWFLGDVDIDDTHGFAWPCTVCQSCGKRFDVHGLVSCPECWDDSIQSFHVVVVTHPAAGLHQTETQPTIWYDFQRLGQYVRGDLAPEPPVDKYPDPDYYEVRVGGMAPCGKQIAVDTEGLKGRVWGGSFSLNPGSAGVVRASNKRAVQYFRDIVLGNTIALHNAPHDIPILAEMFRMPLLDFMSQLKFEDTMQMAYVLRLPPKGLKALCRRYEGMKMRSYLDVVRDADRKIAVEYLKRVLKEKCPACEGLGEVIVAPISEKTGKVLAERPVKCEVCGGDGTTWDAPEERIVYEKGRTRVSTGWRMGRRVRGILKAVDEMDEETGERADLRKRWENIDYDFRLQVDDRLGPMPEVSLDDVEPQSVAVDYSARDADGTNRILPKLEAEVRSEGLWPVYEMDRNIIPMIVRMMDIGWKVDVPYLNALSNKLAVQQDKILYRLEDLIGHPINPNSTDQVGELLFEELGLTPIKTTKEGNESTDNKVLADLRIQSSGREDRDGKKAFEVISLILDYRERGKLRSTYTLALPRQADRNSRIHTTFRVATVESGRLASADPNFMNLPARSEQGKMVRHAFTAEEGNVLIGVDYSQVEVRCVAHASGEQALIDAINKGLDVHSLTTSKIFGIPLDKVTKDMWQRTVSKTLGFGIIYGISAPALRTQIKLLGKMDIPEEQCQQWIDEYTDTTYPAIGAFMLDSIAEAKLYGYVSDPYGRRRYLPGINSTVNSVRSEAERVATNHRIQAFAASLIKLAMALIDREVLPKFRRRGYAECLAQVHDELIFEVKRELAEELMAAVIKVMVSVAKLKVKLGADGHIADRWDALK